MGNGFLDPIFAVHAPGGIGFIGSATLGIRSRISKMRCVAAADRWELEKIRLIESSRVEAADVREKRD